MPRTKRRFADDDPSSESSEDPPDEEEEDDEPIAPRGGGKQLRMMGKQLMRRNDDEDEEEEDDSDDDDDSEEEHPSTRGIMYNHRGGGKQLRPPSTSSSGGKQLRVQDHDDDEEEEDSDDDDEEDEEEDDEVVVPQPRGGAGGKSLARMQHARDGGKQLRPMVEEEEEEEDESDSDDESEYEEETSQQQQQQHSVVRAHGGGKQLRPPAAAAAAAPKQTEESEEEDDEADNMDIDSDDEEEEEEKPTSRPWGGKQLRRPPPAKKQAPKQDEPEDMEESDEDESSEEEELELDMETLDPQKLVQGEEDQKYLESLPEFEREAILGERFEKLKNAADMKKALRESKRKEREERKAAKATKASSKKKTAKAKTAAKKKKAAADEMDTSGDAELAAKLSAGRESLRNRDAKGTKSKKAAALAAFREERKSLKEKQEEEESDLDFGSEGDEDSDDDYEDTSAIAKPWQKKKTLRGTRLQREESEESSSDEYESDRKGDRERSDVVEAELEDYIRVALPRRRLARWCNEPFFETAVKNCFVRLAIGEQDGKKYYRLCEIVDVVPSKSEYKFPVTHRNEKPISSNKALKLKFGKETKVFPMYLVSDSRPTEDDMRKYVNLQKTSRLDVLSKRRAAKLRKHVDQLVTNYTYTTQDIEKAVEARKKSGKGLANIGLEVTKINIAVQAARGAVNDAQKRLDDAKKTLIEYAGQEEVQNLENNVESAEAALQTAQTILESKLEEKDRIMAAAEDRKRRLKKRSKDRNWAKVNERSVMLNQRADFESYKDQLQKQKEEALNADGTPKFNPYARRKVKPKVLWEVGQKDGAEATGDSSSKATGASENKETRDEATTDATKAANGRDEIEKRNSQQEDFFGSQKAELVGESHQFAIDEEVLAQTSTNGGPLGSLGLHSNKRQAPRVRKGLSLQEYQERKAAGTL